MHSIFNTVWVFIRTLIGGVMQTILGIFQLVLGIITLDWDRAWEGIKNILAGAVNILIGILGSLLSLALEILGRLVGGIIGLFADAGSWLFRAGRAILQGLWDGLLSLWNSVKGWISGIADWIVQNKGPVSKDRKLLIPAGRAIMTGLQNGLETGFRQVQSTVLDMSSTLSDSFAGVGTGLGEDWATGFEDGVPRAVDAIRKVGDEMQSTSISGDMSALVQADDFGAVGDQVANAIAGWQVVIDSNGVAKLVRKANTRRDRRGK
jgi:hypothetical protein